MLGVSPKKYYSKELAKKINGRELSLGEIGCYLSHVKIWQSMIDKKIPRIIVLEDDAALQKPFIDFVNNVDKLPKKKWDVITLKTYVELKPFGRKLFGHYKMAYSCRFMNCTGAYLITLSGAEKLLKKAFPIVRPVDGLMGRSNKFIHYYAIYPQDIVLLTDMKSDIWESEDYLLIQQVINPPPT